MNLTEWNIRRGNNPLHDGASGRSRCGRDFVWKKNILPVSTRTVLVFDSFIYLDGNQQTEPWLGSACRYHDLPVSWMGVPEGQIEELYDKIIS